MSENIQNPAIHSFDPKNVTSIMEQEEPDQSMLKTVNLRELRGDSKETGPAQTETPAAWQGNEIGIFGDYEILSQLGDGGMGIVFKARHQSLGRIVAIKISRTESMLSDNDSKKRFWMEAAAAAKLDHPNIVPIFERGECNGRQYISMAFVPGKSLAEEVQAGPLSSDRTATLMLQVANAVAYAHRCGVIHRDVKPENILLDKAGQPRVTDFGLAKFIDTDSHLTQTGDVFGTPSYMSPEQIQGMDQAGPHSDIYSLGATMYCLLTGRPPFQAANSLDTVQQVMDRDPVAPHQLNPKVSRDLETICLKCLEKRPERRYASASDLADDLLRFLEKRPIRARRVRSFEKTIRWCRRNPSVAASVAVVTGIFLAAFALVSWSYWRADEARQDAERKTSMERWERYRSHIAAAASALELNNLSIAKQFLLAAPQEYRGWEWRHFHSQLDSSHFVIDVGATNWDVPAFAVSPAESVVAVGTVEGMVQVRDLATGQVLCSRRDKDTEIREIIFSPDGSLLAYGSGNGEIRLWKHRATDPPTVLGGFHKLIKRMFFNADGSRLLATAEGEGYRVWDVASGNEIQHVEKNMGINIGATPDFSRVFFRVGLNLFTINRTDQAMPPVTFAKHQSEPTHYAVDPAGTIIASASIHPENAVRVWEAATGKQRFVLNGHKNAIRCVRFNHDGTRLASASADQTIRLWNAKAGELVAVLTGHNGPVQEIDFSNDGSRIASASEDGTARLWDTETGACLGVLRGHSNAIYHVRFGATGDWLVTRSADGTLRIWSVAQCESVSFRGHSSFVYDVAFSPDGKYIASAGWDGKSILWQGSDRQPARLFQHDLDIVSSVSFDAGGTRFVTLSRNGDDRFGRKITVWNTITGEKICSAHLPNTNFRDGRAVFHPHEPLIAVGDTLGHVLLIDPDSGVVRAELANGGSQVLDVAFHPNGKQLASAHITGNVTLWDIQSKKLLVDLKAHQRDVTRVQYHPHAGIFATASVDKKVRLWDATTFKQIAELPHGCVVYGLAFHPKRNLLATGCADNTVRLWNLRTLQEVAELRGHQAYVHAVAFSPDGSRLVSASGDHTIRVWDTLSPSQRNQQ